jgi:hypothetical protein
MVSDAKKKSITQKAHLFCFACRFVLPRGGGITERAWALAAVLRLLGAIVDDGAERERGSDWGVEWLTRRL